MSRQGTIVLFCCILFLSISYSPSSLRAQCVKDGDPAFFVGATTDIIYAAQNSDVYQQLGPANFGFVSATCTDEDTFCVHVTDTKGWIITSDPPVEQCFMLNSGSLMWQDIYVSVPCDANVGDRDTVTVVMSYCDDDIYCVPECGDCEDPNWYGGNPYYSTSIFIIEVTQPPPALSILQDSLTLIEQGAPLVGVEFSICNGDICSGAIEYDYEITSMGHIGPPVNTSGTVDVPGGECVGVYAFMDVSEADITDLDTLTIIAWSTAPPIVYDTCVQIVDVVEPVFVPLFSTPAFFAMVLSVILIAVLFIRKRSKMSANNIFIAVVCTCMITFLSTGSEAREKKKAAKEIKRSMSSTEARSYADPYRQMYKSAAVDTYTIVRYDFHVGEWQGWTRVDNTAQPDTFFHVDDFSGLDGGDYGLYYPIEGSKSMWCGARPGSDEYMCSWVSPPGYGNGWNQSLISDPLLIPPPCTFSYKITNDTEPDYDFVYVEYDAGELNWVELAAYEGTIADSTEIHVLPVYRGLNGLFKDRMLPSSGGRTKFRIHFVSDGAWSDQDDLWNTDGACIIDSITIWGSQGLIDYEDFESASIGDKSSGIWRADVVAPFGLYSGMAYNLEDKDPCEDNMSHQIVFFTGSTEPSPDYPGLNNTPFCKGAGGLSAPCQDEMIVSPPIDMTRFTTGRDENQDAEIPGDLTRLGGMKLKFTVYRDLPVPNLVFYYWHVRSIDNGCPGPWQDRTYAYYGELEPDYFFNVQSIGDLVGHDSIQVALGVVDMCDIWYGVYGFCEEHTPSPWFDNVEVQRYESTGPQWSYRDLDLFQDNFPEEEFDLESWVRADNANDLRPNDDPIIDPGDSIVVSVDSPLGGGIDTTLNGYPKVFMRCRVIHLGPDSKTPPSGSILEGNYGHYFNMDGDWTVIQGDFAKTGGGNISPGRYMFDLNDSLFTRGYMIEYYLKAYDFDGESSTLPPQAETAGQYFEFTCLPTLASDILYVDDYHGIGSFDGAVHNYLDQAFRAVLPDTNQPDRYDVNDPASGVSNGPGSRAKNYQLTNAYKKIIWDSGDLDEITISDGSNRSDKSNDCQMLVDWLDFSPHNCGLWIMGDNIAADLAASPVGIAASLMNNRCGVNFVDDSYYGLTGEVVPIVKGTSPGIFYHGGSPDSFYVFGACPRIERFDVLDTINASEYALAYPQHSGSDYYAGIQFERLNLGGHSVKTMWFGMSFMNIADAELVLPIIRNHIMRDVIEWMENDAETDITDDRTPSVYTHDLHQNYPNPFNPLTTFRFSMRERGHVKLKIYNAAGQLVKTLVNEVRAAGPHSVDWNGTNNRGERIASGIYFCRMEAKDFKKVRKVVLIR